MRNTSENALSRTCARSTTRIASTSVPHTAADSGNAFRPISEPRRPRPGRPQRRCRRHRRGKRCADAGVRQAADACIREVASARRALPPRLPWTSCGSPENGGATAARLQRLLLPFRRSPWGNVRPSRRQSLTSADLSCGDPGLPFAFFSAAMSREPASPASSRRDARGPWSSGTGGVRRDLPCWPPQSPRRGARRSVNSA